MAQLSTTPSKRGVGMADGLGADREIQEFIRARITKKRKSNEVAEEGKKVPL